MWTLIGVSTAVLVACTPAGRALFIPQEEEHDRKPGFFKRRDRPF
jgi:hypothetical protein